MEEQSKERVAWNKGKEMSEETRQKLSNSCKGRVPWNKGKTCPQLTGNRKSTGKPAWNRVESDVTCAMCGNIFHLRPALVKKAKLHYCSPRCMGDHRKVIYSGENNPYFGKEHPNKGMARDEEVCKKISEANKGCIISKEHRRKISIANKGKPGVPFENNHFTGNKTLARKAAMVMMHNRRSNFLTGKFVHAGVNMRSSWEVEYAKLLDSLETKWEYESKEIDLGELGIYVPDFYIPAWDVYVEIKGWKSETGMDKFNKFKEMKGWRAVLIDEAKMKEIGIYKKERKSVI
jgi:hypothetical protein